MKYTAKIDYVNNVEKAGKLTLTSEDGATILSKVAVAIPDEMLLNPILFQKIHSTRAVQVKMDDDLRRFDKSGKYEDAYSEVTKGNPDAYFIKNTGKVLIRPTTDAKLKNDDHSFVMHKEHFDVLFTVLAKKHQLEIETNKVSFLWFPEKVINATGGINVVLSNFDSVESKLRNDKDDAERISALEAAQKKAKVNVSSKSSLNDAVKNIAKIVEQEAKPVAKSVAKPTIAQPAKQFTRQPVIQAVPTSTTRITYRDADDLDALDIILMYSNPGLAPFIKPNSMLAWSLYFNNRQNEINKQYIEENIRNVSGFENVGSSDFKYTPKGYSVTLFEDETRGTPIGRLEYDSQRNCYEIVSESGDKNTLSVGNDGQYNSCFVSSSGNETNVNLVQTNSGFVGNWESDNNGVKVNSGISIDNDFGYTSSPNEPVDITKVQPYIPSYEAEVAKTFDFGSSEPVVSNDNDLGYNKGYEPPPPPPPPPPKNDDVWSSSDPYSNSSSFRM